MVNVGGKKKSLMKIKSHSLLKKIIDYFIKYIQKSIFENSFPNQKKYITSKGLIKPQAVYVEEAINLIKELLPEETLVFKHDGEKDYIDGKTENDFLKWINYEQYNLASFPSLNSTIDDIISDYSFCSSSEAKPKDNLADLDFDISKSIEMNDRELKELFQGKQTQPPISNL